MSIEVDGKTFDAMVQKAITSLPEKFREALEVVRVEVRDRPTSAQLASVGVPEEELLLGLYEGVPLTERTVNDAPRPPDVIFLFREDLEDACDEVGQLEREVRITLLHELGHYFGFGEEELDQLGYG
jgi:predicted Zn-dependent protease with MMP-like domain